MLFPPVFAAEMSSSEKAAAEEPWEEWVHTKKDHDHAAAHEVVASAPAQAPHEDVAAAPVLEKEEESDSEEDCDMEPDSPWHMPQSAWTKVTHCYEQADDQTKVRMDSISMTFIDAEGKGKKVPRPRSRAAVSSEQDDGDDGTGEPSGDVAGELITILFTCIGRLHDRCTALEALLETELKGGRAAASSSSSLKPDEEKGFKKKVKGGAAASSSRSSQSVDGAAASSSEPASRKRPVEASSDHYDLPQRRPWRTTDGKCDRCGLDWSTDWNKDNFPASVWESIMTRMYHEWTEEKRRNGHKCRLLGSYIHTSSRVVHSLSGCGVIDEDETARYEANVRNRLFQPDVVDDTKPLWLYGSKGEEKYLTFGCIFCHRGSSLYYSDENFMEKTRVVLPGLMSMT